MTHPIEHYQRLSAQDASFLASESLNRPMVIASLIIYDGSNLKLPDGSLDFPRLRRRFEAALSRAPCLVKRLAWVPVFNHPVWVDAGEVDLDAHLYRVALPRPADDAQLIRFVERVHCKPIPRDRPLWDAWVIEDLADDRFAILLRLHHALVDGSSGLDLMRVLHDAEAEVGEAPGEAPSPRPLPVPLELLAGELRERLEGARSLFTDALNAVRNPVKTVERGIELAEGFVDAARTLAQPSPIDAASGGGRRVDCFTMPLDELNTIRRRLGGTLNDLMLTLIAGGLRGYLEADGHPVADLKLRAACPSNTRTPGQHSEGNRTASFVVDLPTDEPIPLVRHEAVVRATRRAKESHQADAVQFAIELADRAAPELVGNMIGLSNRFQNLVISNMAGPPAAIHFLGCRALELHPIAMLLEGAGLAITVFSYDGRMSWTLCANASVIPSLAPLQRAILREFEYFRTCTPDVVASDEER